MPFPSAAAAMSAGPSCVVEGTGDAVGVAVHPRGRIVGEDLVGPAGQLDVVAEVGDRLGEIHAGQLVTD